MRPYDLSEPASGRLPDPTRTVLLEGTSVEAKRAEILEYFCQTFDLYDSLYDCIAEDRGWFTKAIALRHPLVFYYGHTAAFFINKLLADGQINQRIDASIEAQVAIGVDEMSWDDLDEGHYDWPSIATLRDYRARVRERVIETISLMPLTLPITWDSPAWVILMGIEHERIHLETSSVLIRQLPIEWVRPQPHWPHCQEARRERRAAPVNRLVRVSGGEIVLGKRDQTYGWDNEYGQQRVSLEAFAASSMLVSNSEYYDFVVAGGYAEPKWWSAEGWAWRCFARADQPTFWVGRSEDPEQLRLRLMTCEVPMAWDWPADVNALEAAAFCRWKAAETGRSIQLPCEAEWAMLRATVPGDQPDWNPAPGNINLEHAASACPVDRFPQGAGFYDIVGNVWQWTSTPISGYEGFRVHPRYDDFSTPTFDGKHDLIKGGSWISTGNEALASGRYAFRRHFFQHAGFRYVDSSYKGPPLENPYETDEQVCQYLDFHYGQTYFGVPNFSNALARRSIELCPDGGRALDLGCAVGRASLELARHFSHVDGVDFSARFIDAAGQMISQGGYRYTVPLEGDLVEYCEASLASLGLEAEQLARIHFSQGDAQNLLPKYKDYDLVLAANLIDRLQEPLRFLNEIGARIKPGGLLVLTSPYTWLEAFTPRGNWLGGYRENGESRTTYRALQLVLAEQFEEVGSPEDVPFVIRETARKHQHTVAQMTFWRRRAP